MLQHHRGLVDPPEIVLGTARDYLWSGPWTEADGDHDQRWELRPGRVKVTSFGQCETTFSSTGTLQNLDGGFQLAAG
jgi:hypothetical protein